MNSEGFKELYTKCFQILELGENTDFNTNSNLLQILLQVNFKAFNGLDQFDTFVKTSDEGGETYINTCLLICYSCFDICHIVHQKKDLNIDSQILIDLYRISMKLCLKIPEKLLNFDVYFDKKLDIIAYAAILKSFNLIFIKLKENVYFVQLYKVMSRSFHVLITRLSNVMDDSIVKVNTVQAIKYLFIFLTSKLATSTHHDLNDEYSLISLSMIKYIRFLCKFENTESFVLFDSLELFITEHHGLTNINNVATLDIDEFILRIMTDSSKTFSLELIMSNLAGFPLETLILNKFTSKTRENTVIFLTFFDLIIIKVSDIILNSNWDDIELIIFEKLCLGTSVEYLVISDAWLLIIVNMPQFQILSFAQSLLHIITSIDINSLVYQRLSALFRRIVIIHPEVLCEFSKLPFNDLLQVINIFKNSNILNSYPLILKKYHQNINNLNENNIELFRYMCNNSSNINNSIDLVKITDILIKKFALTKKIDLLAIICILMNNILRCYLQDVPFLDEDWKLLSNRNQIKNIEQILSNLPLRSTFLASKSLASAQLTTSSNDTKSDLIKLKKSSTQIYSRIQNLKTLSPSALVT
ncbi:hypothetical protein MXB_4916 [Myxobolus squamalis]|nr:hypothetical protein MXB_4916 [Myxobolus squamalis]